MFRYFYGKGTIPDTVGYKNGKYKDIMSHKEAYSLVRHLYTFNSGTKQESEKEVWGGGVCTERGCWMR